MRYYLFGAGLLLSSGCVSQAKYDDLHARYEQAQAQLGERQQRLGTLGVSVQTAKEEVKRLRGEKEGTERMLEALAAEHARLHEEQERMAEETEALAADRSRLQASSDRLRSALQDMSQHKAEAERRIAEFKSLLLRFKDLIDAGKLKVTMTDGRMVLQLPTDVLFDSGSARLSSEGKEAIVEITQVLKEVGGRRYQVEGHTDNVPIHTERYPSNWELASARGLSVVYAMREAGMDQALLSAASYGEYHPVASNEGEEGRAENRRIEIILVPDLSLLPGYDELQRVVEAN